MPDDKLSNQYADFTLGRGRSVMALINRDLAQAPANQVGIARAWLGVLVGLTASLAATVEFGEGKHDATRDATAALGKLLAERFPTSCARFAEPPAVIFDGDHRN